MGDIVELLISNTTLKLKLQRVTFIKLDTIFDPENKFTTSYQPYSHNKQIKK
jgi:hypothetical protein